MHRLVILQNSDLKSKEKREREKNGIIFNHIAGSLNVQLTTFKITPATLSISFLKC